MTGKTWMSEDDRTSIFVEKSTEQVPGGWSAPDGFVFLDEIGRGGMGVIYRAEDLSLGREVAVKVLQQRFAPDSPTARRFIDEARVTAQIQHPGVPAVYQMGTLKDGRPFLAMKLIRGETLDQLIKTGVPLDVLAIFEAIAHTVGFAHTRGVIHRDLKPANIMVGAFGEVQVMDWGLSKVRAPKEPARVSVDPEATTDHPEIRSLRGSDGDKTEAGRVLGTPAYMSPEQAAGEGDKVDARSDVFGLGAILCAMLTGKPPFEGDDAESVRLNAMRGRTESAFALLDRCHADPDVVALCKKCLAFDRADRPTDADEVSLEVAALRSVADDRAKTAEHERLSAEVRANEQKERRRAVQRWAIAACAVLVVGIVGTSAGLIWADKARRTAIAKEQEAERIADFFQKRIFAAPRPKGKQGGLGKDVSLRDAIAAALPHLDEGFKDQPLVEARLRQAIGATFWQLGHYEDALKQHERCQAIFRDKLGPGHPSTLNAADHVANVLIPLGRAEEAVKLHQQVLEARTHALGAEHEETFDSMDHLAFAFTALDRHADALPLQEKVLEGRKRLLGERHEDTLASANNLAVNYAGLNRSADALKLREEWLPTFERVHPPDHVDLISFRSNLANCYFDAGRLEDALKLRSKVLEARSAALGRNHPDTLHSICGLAQVLLALGRGAEAIPLVDECYAHAKRAGPMIVTLALAVRMKHFQKTGDAVECRRTAEMWEKLDRTSGDACMDGACFRAVASELFAKANKPGEAAAEADRAMKWLQQGVAAGFSDVEYLKKDHDLDALRGRADFKELLASLEGRKAKN